MAFLKAEALLLPPQARWLRDCYKHRAPHIGLQFTMQLIGAGLAVSSQGTTAVITSSSSSSGIGFVWKRSINIPRAFQCTADDVPFYTSSAPRLFRQGWSACACPTRSRAWLNRLGCAIGGPTLAAYHGRRLQTEASLTSTVFPEPFPGVLSLHDAITCVSATVVFN